DAAQLMHDVLGLWRSDAERGEEVLVLRVQRVGLERFLESLQVPDFEVVLLAEYDDVLVEYGVGSQTRMDQDAALGIAAGRLAIEARRTAILAPRDAGGRLRRQLLQHLFPRAIRIDQRAIAFDAGDIEAVPAESLLDLAAELRRDFHASLL